MRIRRWLAGAVCSLAVATVGVVAIPSTAFASQYQSSNCAWETSYSYYTCITQNWNSKTANGRPYVEVDNYTVAVTTFGHNPGSVTFSLDTIAGAQGGVLNGGYCVNCTQEWRSGSYGGNGSWQFTYTPSWSGWWIDVGGPHNYQCGNVLATFRHGGSQWNLQVPGVCQGHL